MATSSVSPLSTAWVQNLVELTLSSERKPLETLQTKRDTLQVRKGIYSDIGTKIKAVQTAITALQGTNNVFKQKAVSVKNSSDTINVVSATTNGTSAGVGEYNLTVTKLAQSHQVSSTQQAHTDVALGWEGTFYIGGAANRSVTGNIGTGNPLSASPFGVDDIREDEKELGTGEYSIEFRQNSGVWQFRIVDAEGKAVSIDNAADTTGDTMTSNWQDYSAVKNTTFNTERGLTIEFDDADPTQQYLFGDANIAKVSYVAKGAEISVATTDSLVEIRSKINNGTYAEGNKVQASIVDNRLILTGVRSGANAAIQMSDKAGSTNMVLQSLNILDINGALKDDAQLGEARNADITLNNSLHITNRTRNTGLTDLVQGLSINLLAEGSSATITVTDNNDKIKEQVQDFVKAVNSLRSYLKEKTEAKAGDKDDKGNTTYTPAALGQDWSMRSLRQEIATNLLKVDSQATAGMPKYFSEIGITVNDDGEFELDSTKLETMLNSNFDGVNNLFDHLLEGDGSSSDTSLYARLNRYVDGTSSVLTTTQTGLDNEIKNANEQISSYQTRLKVRETALYQQYSAIQQQMLSMTYSYQQFAAGSSYNQQY